MADQTVFHLEDWADISSPVAPNGGRIKVVIEAVNSGPDGDLKGQIRINMTTENFAVTDIIRGTIKVGLLDNGALVAQYDLECPDNPSRNLLDPKPTVREASRCEELPIGFKFNSFQIQYRNYYFPQPQPIDWKPFEVLASIVVAVLGIVATA